MKPSLYVYLSFFTAGLAVGASISRFFMLGGTPHPFATFVFFPIIALMIVGLASQQVRLTLGYYIGNAMLGIGALLTTLATADSVLGWVLFGVWVLLATMDILVAVRVWRRVPEEVLSAGDPWSYRGPLVIR